MGLVLACCSWQHLAVFKQNTAEHGLLGRTISPSETRRNLSVLLAF